MAGSISMLAGVNVPCIFRSSCCKRNLLTRHGATHPIPDEKERDPEKCAAVSLRQTRSICAEIMRKQKESLGRCPVLGCHFEFHEFKRRRHRAADQRPVAGALRGLPRA